MLEHYVAKPQTADRIRSSWLGEPIGRYVTWLAEHGYQAHCVHTRVPLLMRFAAFARQRGATQLDGLAAHTEGFIQRRLRQRLRPCGSTAARQKYIHDIRQPIEQFLRVTRVDEPPPGASKGAYPLVHWAPHFLTHLQHERGLSPTTIQGYATQLRSFERYAVAQRLDGPQALTPTVLDSFLAEKRTHVCARSLTSTCAALRTWLRYLYRKGLTKRDFSTVIEGPRTSRTICDVRGRTRRSPTPHEPTRAVHAGVIRGRAGRHGRRVAQALVTPPANRAHGAAASLAQPGRWRPSPAPAHVGHAAAPRSMSSPIPASIQSP